MRSLRLREGFHGARRVHLQAWRLMRQAPLTTALLGAVLALLPSLLKAYFAVTQHYTLISRWESWFDTFFRGNGIRGLVTLLTQTLQSTGQMSLGLWIVNTAQYLVLSPLLLSSLALLYNGGVSANDGALSTAKMALRNVRSLIIVALACALAEWFLQMVPSLANGLLSLLTGLLSWIPLLGTIARVLAVGLSILITLLTALAVTVIFCYVWICAACENVPGFGALVRSWQLTRNAMRETVFSLVLLILLRWGLVLLAGALCIALHALWGLPLFWLLYAFYAVSALYTVAMGAVTSALYQNRPIHSIYGPGRGVQNMKRANID